MWTASWQTMGPFTRSFCNKNIGRSLDKVSIVSSEIGRLRKCEGNSSPDCRVIGGQERCSSIKEEKGSIESVRFYAQFPPAILSFLYEIKATVKLCNRRRKNFSTTFTTLACSALHFLKFPYLMSRAFVSSRVNRKWMDLEWFSTMETFIEWLLLKNFFWILPYLLEMNFIY